MITHEIDIGKTQAGKFALDFNGERILVSESLGEVITRLENELKKAYNIKSGFLERFKK